jgi:hypothetical protein
MVTDILIFLFNSFFHSAVTDILIFYSKVTDIPIFPFHSHRYFYFSIQQLQIFLFIHSTLTDIPISLFKSYRFSNFSLNCHKYSYFLIQHLQIFLFFHSIVTDISFFQFRYQKIFFYLIFIDISILYITEKNISHSILL